MLGRRQRVTLDEFAQLGAGQLGLTYQDLEHQDMA